MGRLRKKTNGWRCPKCRRQFGSKNQWHSCVKVRPSGLLEGRALPVRNAYGKLVALIKKLSSAEISAAKSGVFAKCPTTFLAVKFSKEQLILEFFLPERTDEFPVVKAFPYTKNKVVHVVHWDGGPAAWKVIQKWIRVSYGMQRKTQNIN